MAQIFRPNSNIATKISLIVGAIAPLAIITTMSQFTRSSYVTKQNIAYEQPVPFSHEHHVTELGIDCRYCHAGVEISAQASYPPTHTCMSCHSQVWTNSPLLEPVRESYTKNVPLKWTVLNKVPDFVYFNHSIHINRGVSCNNCHGPVQAMQMVYKGQAFQMRWCLDCHRNPEKYVGPREQVFTLYQDIQRGHRVGVDQAGDPLPLTPEEETLKEGKQYVRTPAELAVGRDWVKKYHIKTQQLTDCSVCHH